jgi:uncharacterized protein (DUF983 family)
VNTPAKWEDEAHWVRLLGRGFTKRCPNCGGRGIYDTWFRMKDRCPTCGLRFEREEGFFVGAYLINFAVSIILLFVLCMGFVGVKAADPDAEAGIFLAAGVLIGLLAPVVFYPFSRTVWSAIDLGMTPLEPEELREAESARVAAPVDA